MPPRDQDHEPVTGNHANMFLFVRKTKVPCRHRDNLHNPSSDTDPRPFRSEAVAPPIRPIKVWYLNKMQFNTLYSSSSLKDTLRIQGFHEALKI